jgi:hypothetical protein
MNKKIEKYVSLLSCFTSCEISGEEFQRKYLSLFASETEPMPPQVFELTNELFYVVECYVADPRDFDQNDVNYQTLMDAAHRCLSKLKLLTVA